MEYDNRLNDIIDVLLAKCKEYEIKEKEYISKIDKLEKENEKLHNENNALNSQLVELKNKIKEINAENKELNREVVGLYKKNSYLSTKLNAILYNNDSLTYKEGFWSLEDDSL